LNGSCKSFFNRVYVGTQWCKQMKKGLQTWMFTTLLSSEWSISESNRWPLDCQRQYRIFHRTPLYYHSLHYNYNV